MWLSVLAAILSLAGFIGGLRLMRSGLEGMAQGKLPVIILRFVGTPTRGILTGMAATAIVQSSAAITAICVGMVAGGTLGFREALGLVLGSNVGSTITPQLLTLNLTVITIPCLITGFLLFVFARERYSQHAKALVGFASIFIALRSLTLALHPIAGSNWFLHLIERTADQPLAAVLAGCIASAAVQSSTAVTILTMALVSNQAMPLHSAIAVILGANIGTCFTSVIAALGQSRPAQQVALSHVVLNVGGVAMILPFLAPFTEFVKWLGGSPDQQIANAHTLFNVASTLLVWPMTQPFANLITRLLPDHRRT